ncbi:hypothetical protein [Williamsia sp. 1135]|uniref:hypothetical protein n=1 Tax=Williamsia sp. 1135 TaxID=1889262 RepID=UPI000A117FAF|nr:hypothetical protein [Williamsia sp. 1135]ORM36216.1 hypothetical protein BFL43_07745 [Williamsia sp. 1135]
MSTTYLAVETITVLAIDQPTPIQPPGGEGLLKLVGASLWIVSLGFVAGIILGSGWMWFDAMNGAGARGGIGVKVVIGALIGAIVCASAAALITFFS